MKRIVLFSLVLMVVLTTGVAPQMVYGFEIEDVSMLTPEERSFISTLESKSWHVEFDLKQYETILENPRELYLALHDPEKWRSVSAGLKPFPGDCELADAPITMQDIMEQWNIKVCRMLEHLWLAYTQLAPSQVTVFSAEYGHLNKTIDRIWDALDEIEEMTNQRVAELAEAAEEKEKKEDNGGTGGEKDKGGDAGSSRSKDKKDSEDIFDIGCFIATAAYGTPEAEEIDSLRRFRDEFLLHSFPGRAFVAVYYAVSPPIAEFISEHEVLRVAVREVFVDHLVTVVELTESRWGE